MVVPCRWLVLWPKSAYLSRLNDLFLSIYHIRLLFSTSFLCVQTHLFNMKMKTCWIGVPYLPCSTSPHIYHVSFIIYHGSTLVFLLWHTFYCLQERMCNKEYKELWCIPKKELTYTHTQTADKQSKSAQPKEELGTVPPKTSTTPHSI